MTEWTKSIGAITLFVEDLDHAKAFYRDVFDLPIAYEDENSAVFNFQDVSINLLIIPAAHELINPPWLPVVTPARVSNSPSALMTSTPSVPTSRRAARRY